MGSDTPIVIAISGKKRHGKDTTCNELIRLFAEKGIVAVRRAFADPLKEEVALMLALQDAYESDGYSAGINQQELNKRFGFYLSQFNHEDDQVKELWRPLLKWYGTEYRRAQDPNYWVNRMKDWLEPGDHRLDNIEVVLIPDARFLNEVEADFTKYKLRVIRMAWDNKDAHASEIELDDYTSWDGVVEAESLDDLLTRVEDIFYLSVLPKVLEYK